MIYINPYQFYSEVVDGNRPIDEIFTTLASTLSSEDFDELYEAFTIQLEEKIPFDPSFAQKAAGKYEIPMPHNNRVLIAKMILSVCALGASFNDSVFHYSMDYILKKELCTIPLFLN